MPQVELPQWQVILGAIVAMGYVTNGLMNLIGKLLEGRRAPTHSTEFAALLSRVDSIERLVKHIDKIHDDPDSKFATVKAVDMLHDMEKMQSAATSGHNEAHKTIMTKLDSVESAIGRLGP